MVDIRRLLPQLMGKIYSNEVARRYLWTIDDVPCAWIGQNQVREGCASIAAQPKICNIFNARDKGVLHYQYCNNSINYRPIQHHRCRIFDLGEGRVDFGQLIWCIFVRMTILRSGMKFLTIAHICFIIYQHNYALAILHCTFPVIYRSRSNS